MEGEMCYNYGDFQVCLFDRPTKETQSLNRMKADQSLIHPVHGFDNKSPYNENFAASQLFTTI